MANQNPKFKDVRDSTAYINTYDGCGYHVYGVAQYYHSFDTIDEAKELVRWLRRPVDIEKVEKQIEEFWEN